MNPPKIRQGHLNHTNASPRKEDPSHCQEKYHGVTKEGTPIDLTVRLPRKANGYYHRQPRKTPSLPPRTHTHPSSSSNTLPDPQRRSPVSHRHRFTRGTSPRKPASSASDGHDKEVPPLWWPVGGTLGGGPRRRCYCGPWSFRGPGLPSSSLETVRTVTRRSWSLRTSQIVQRSDTSR